MNTFDNAAKLYTKLRYKQNRPTAAAKNAAAPRATEFTPAAPVTTVEVPVAVGLLVPVAVELGVASALEGIKTL